jgi:hypothetical protein
VNTLFTKLSPSETGINFTNQLDLNENFDVFRYRNYYNGGGVAIGDINNDGLPDVYLTANTQKNKLYLNKGNLKFEDITEKAGVGGKKAWSTGVSMADINGDGLLDIYVCNSGNTQGDDKENELFINNGNLTFTEKAREYGLADAGFSTHAAFFDYDLDGDLDCYLLNNSFRPIGSFGFENIRHERDEKGGDKLYRNDNNKFTDISDFAGIYGSVIGFGLGIAVSDVNMDGWPDLYISNDFFERDYLYINQKNGKFKESLTQYIRHTSEFSMGSDIGDLNDDGYPEIFTTDMLPEDDARLKTTQSFISYDIQETRLENDYYDQFMRNNLQLNNGDSTFSEIGLYAGVAATDWSWGALIADYDNDGNKEIYITNGIYKDVTDQDFINFMANDESLAKIQRGEKIDFKALVDKMPSTKLKNYLFKRNTNSLKFNNLAKEWGLDEPSFSNGAAYGDLDNDGDLDLIVNNVNQELFFYRNNAEKLTKNNYLKIKLKGEAKNLFAVGAKICLIHQGQKKFYEHFPTRGFESSMDYTATLGLGSWSEVDTVKITFPNQKILYLKKVKANQTITADIKNAQKVEENITDTSLLINPINLKIDFKHQENQYIDFDYERLIYHMNSRQGPALAVADLNGDGLDDFYIGGAFEQTGAIFLQNNEGFTPSNQSAFAKDIIYEDVDAQFFDADQDGDLDLLVVSGGSESKAGNFNYQSRLYLNKGSKINPVFEFAKDNLPSINESSSCVAIADFDDDKDLDIFLGSRLKIGQYGASPDSYLLENDGKGKFADVTSEKIPQLRNFGMVTDAIWQDYDGDGALDLILVGEWMPITVFKNKGVGFQKVKNVAGFENSAGFWNTILAFDANQDGKEDLLLGNLGLNSRFKASEKSPFQLYISDFDENNSLDHIFAHQQNNKTVPFALKQDLTRQLNNLKKQFLYHRDYANKSIEEVFGKDKISQSLVLNVQTFASMIAINQGNGKYTLKELPEEAQFSTIQAFNLVDVDNDGQNEVVLGGNFSATKPEVGKYDAGYGLILKADKNGNLKTIKSRESGLSVIGDTRKIGVLKTKNGEKLLAFALNNAQPKFFKIKPKAEKIKQ